MQDKSSSPAASPGRSASTREASVSQDRHVAQRPSTLMEHTSVVQALHPGLLDQHLHSERSHAVHLERENQDLSGKLYQMQQEHKKLQMRYDGSKQEVALLEKDQLISQLHNRLTRLTNMAAAVADEVQCATSAIAAAGSHRTLYGATNKQPSSQQGASATRSNYSKQAFQEHEEGGKQDVLARLQQEQQQPVQDHKPSPSPHQQMQGAIGLAAAAALKAAGFDPAETEAGCAAFAAGFQQSSPHKAAAAAAAAVAALSRLQQQQGALTASAAAHAGAAAAAAAEAAAASAGARASTSQLIGSKRNRLCSATGSGGEVTTFGAPGAPTAGSASLLKRAVSGGSSSSRQQLSDEDMAEPGDEADCDGNVCFSVKRQRSPGASSEQVTTPGSETAAGIEATTGTGSEEGLQDEECGDDEDDKSQDEVDAAQCLQALAMSVAAESQRFGSAAPTSRVKTSRLPSAFESVSYSEGAGFTGTVVNGGMSRILPGGGQHRWTGSKSGPGPAANGPLTGSLSFGGNGSNSRPSGPFTPLVQSHVLGFLNNGWQDPHNDYSSLLHQQQQQKQKKMPAGGYMQHTQQHMQQYGPSVSISMPGSVRRPSAGVDGPWNPAGSLKGPNPQPLAAGALATAAPVRTRKQSWFQTEIAEKIPLSVQQACAQDWTAQQCMQVVCADLCGTFYVNSAGEYLIKLNNSGEVVTPNKFEELAGKKTARNWQQSIRLVGYTMNGEPNSALLKLGHFTRIVGLVQDR